VSVETIPPEPLRSVPGLDNPEWFYQVLRAPAPLAGMPLPSSTPWKSVAAAGFHSVVCLIDDTPRYDPSPLRVLRAVKFKDLLGGGRPADPEREAAKLSEVVQAIVAELKSGRGVVVHCMGGTGRTGTVIACVLAVLGMSEGAVMEYMKRVNAARGRLDGWPESQWQRDQVARFVVKGA
jgi:hypothetical protein